MSTLPLPECNYPVIAAGQTALGVGGDYSVAYDVNAGLGTDQPTATRGVYSSRYSS